MAPNKLISRSWHRIDIGILAGLSLLMFLDILFNSNRILSQQGTDISGQFLAWREFGFEQLRSGNLALWNPYVFSGIPYVGGFQSSMFYPLNWIFLIMPVAIAINLSIALHIFFTGAFMYLLAMYRGLHRVAAVTTGALLMFCGAGFLHIYAGHLSNICAMPWTPLIFLAIDGLFKTRQLRWVLLGIGAMAMQILAGHPQYVFYTGVAAGIYVCFRFVRAEQRFRIAGGLLAILAGGVAITAIQLWTGIDASSESLRSKGVPYEFAAMFSLPPENLLTMVAPGLFGDLSTPSYWGRCYLWETSVFFGVTGLVLAIYGAIRGEKKSQIFSLPMTLILLTLALGSHTPLFQFLYNYIPGFNLFRGNSKFIWEASIFLTLLSGIGLDVLLRSKQKILVWPIFCGAVALAMGALILLLGSGGGNADWWRDIVNAMLSTHESYLASSVAQSREFLKQSVEQASWALLKASGVLALLGALILGARHTRWPLYGVAALAILEVFTFAYVSRASLDVAQTRMPELEQFLASNPGDYRILSPIAPNFGMSIKKSDIWGNDPGVSLRYAEFIAHTQHINPDDITQNMQISQPSQLFRMLRLKYVFLLKDNHMQVITAPSPMDRAMLLYDYKVIKQRDAIFNAMDAVSFDPSKSVILESKPTPAPVLATQENKGAVHIVNSSTDEITFEADLSSPAILLVTDVYSKNWRVRALEGSTQTNYNVMPANYTLIGIPLSAGHHYFQLEYMPAAFQRGMWISIMSLVMFLAILGWDIFRRIRRRP